ncbi:MAG: FAD-dependent oxidoreductase, partial [Coriobacteriia bacterium]|nr:FAD-dependent oxidoreductase [Coriobacteriia bacterium]
DEPIAIAQLKRAAADFGAYPRRERPRPRPESIAIVGSGPAGLTAAHDLASWGFAVTLIEETPQLGGTMRYGIPSYRLPDYALNRDIDYILSTGVQVQTGVRVGRDITLEELAAANDAVVLAVGLQNSRSLSIPGADGSNVMTALPFLKAVATGECPEVGDRVVVIGGGNVAVDVARTARRLGAENVQVVCIESRDEMPASQHEIQDAELEGIKIHCSWGPKSISPDSDGCTLETMACTSVFDADKRFSPTFDESVNDRFTADTVILAIGQSADIRDLNVAMTPGGTPEVDPLTLKTSMDKVYAAGDVVSGPTRIIDAIAAGHLVAASIYRDLSGDGRPLSLLGEEGSVLGDVPDAMATKLETRRRVQMERVEFFDAVKTFEEVEQGYTEYEAAREAQRCLSCTTGVRLTREKCASCLTCVRVCPHDAPVLEIGGYLYFDADACHACGACVSQCPALAISLEGHSEEELSQRVQRLLADAGMNTTMVFACSSAAIVPDLGDADTRTLTVSCLLRVSERTVIETLRNEATRVVFAGCVESTCRFPHARDLVKERAQRIDALLAHIDMTGAFVMCEYDDTDLDWHLR